jgi:diadenosine tetraphosphatase ApaH/serine/threonine PP2A family protein phosphatase
MDRPVCFVGHTHVPRIFVYHNRNVYQIPETTTELNPVGRYIVNAGSVGQPRDGNPLASYGIYDSEARTVEIKRVPYDIKAARTKILSAGLPAVLAQRLSVGR